MVCVHGGVQEWIRNVKGRLCLSVKSLVVLFVWYYFVRTKIVFWYPHLRIKSWSLKGCPLFRGICMYTWTSWLLWKKLKEKKLQTRNKYFFLPFVATAKKKVKRSRLLTFSKFLICVSMHADPQCLPSCLVKHFQHFRLDSHEPQAASVLSHGNYSLLPWQNNNSLNKEHNTDELSDLTHFTAHPPSPSSFLSFHPVSFFFSDLFSVVDSFF